MTPQAVAPVMAWGAVARHVVARVAWALLEGGQGAFVTAATWADEVRSLRPETYNWPFVDIPISESRYDAAREYPADRGDRQIVPIRARFEATRRAVTRRP